MDKYELQHMAYAALARGIESLSAADWCSRDVSNHEALVKQFEAARAAAVRTINNTVRQMEKNIRRRSTTRRQT